MDCDRTRHWARVVSMEIGLLVVLAATPAYGINDFFKVSQLGNGVQIWFEAENFDERCPGPFEVEAPDLHAAFPVVEVEWAFDEGEDFGIGRVIQRMRTFEVEEDGVLRYDFDISEAGGEAGTWYFWARTINTSNWSDYLLVEGDPEDPIPGGDCEAGGFPAGPDATWPGGGFTNGDHRVFEINTGSLGPPPVWGWSQSNHEEGHTKTLRDGLNSMYFYRREHSDTPRYWDVFVWTNDPDYTPNEADYLEADIVLVTPPECDPPDPDTHCNQIVSVEGPPGNLEGLYQVTVDATDDGGDPIRYQLTAENEEGVSKILDQTDNNVFDVALGPGSWTLSVTVDDDPRCPDAADDNTCASFGPIEVVAKPDSDFRVSHIDGGTQIWIQAEKFDERFDDQGPDPDPPVEPHAAFPIVAAEGAFGDPQGNAIGRTAVDGMLVYHFDITLDFNDSGTIDLTDPIANLGHQFLGSAPPEVPGKDSCGVDPTDDDGIDCDGIDCADYPTENC